MQKTERQKTIMIYGKLTDSEPMGLASRGKPALIRDLLVVKIIRAAGFDVLFKRVNKIPFGGFSTS